MDSFFHNRTDRPVGTDFNAVSDSGLKYALNLNVIGDLVKVLLERK
jgi:hypothetical protein